LVALIRPHEIRIEALDERGDAPDESQQELPCRARVSV
jgi:hypothetical protein